MLSYMHDFGMYIKVFSTIIIDIIYLLYIYIIFLEMCSCYRESSKAKVLSGFLVIATSLTSITNLHLMCRSPHVSVLSD